MMQLFLNTESDDTRPATEQTKAGIMPAGRRNRGPSAEVLENFIDDPQLMAEVGRLLAGRTRDIRLRGKIAEAFRQRTWRHTASVIRSWMISVVLLDLFMLLISMFLLPRDAALAVIVPGGLVLPAALGVAFVWLKPRSQPVLGGALVIGMLVILLSVCWMGVAAGGLLLDRYLHIMLCVAITGVVIFSIPFALTLAIAAMAMVLYLTFQLGFAGTDVGIALVSSLFFASGIGATILARRTMNILAYRSFLLELRDRQNLAELAETNRRLERLSMIDGLTGAANRHFLRNKVESLWERKGSVALFMCDIDDFKALNDHLGHQAGDTCLAEVARIIAACTRSDLDCVARYGGEEFVVLLPDLDEAEALTVAERIRGNVLAAALPNPGSRVKSILTLSIGVAVGQVASLSSELLQKRADAALYLAKRSGKNQVRMWNEGMNSRGKVSSVA